MKAPDIARELRSIGGGTYFPDGKPNRYRARPLSFPMSQEGAEEFNGVYRKLLSLGLGTVETTPSGALGSPWKSSRTDRAAMEVKVHSTGVAIYVTYGYSLYAYTFGSACKKGAPKGIYPAQAWSRFGKELMADGVDIDSFAINPIKGLVEKQFIPKALIKMTYHMGPSDPGLDNCHHVDFHSSYPAGLANTHPEFRKTMERLYDERHEPGKSDIYKAILNYSIGAMQSTDRPWEARWAHLAKDAISDNLGRVRELASRLRKAGCEVLGFNTDGIWYRGDIYHGKGEGDRLGEWRNDHTGCTFRSKSDGAYEFVEDGRYNPVLRGTIAYDGIKPRSQWQWGDIYRGEVMRWDFIPGEGLRITKED